MSWTTLKKAVSSSLITDYLVVQRTTSAASDLHINHKIKFTYSKDISHLVANNTEFDLWRTLCCTKISVVRNLNVCPGVLQASSCPLAWYCSPGWALLPWRPPPSPWCSPPCYLNGECLSKPRARCCSLIRTGTEKGIEKMTGKKQGTVTEKILSKCLRTQMSLVRY